jgi:hypothetical protein
MTREIKYHSKGLSFIDANHLVYAEGVLARNRRKEGRKLNILDELYDCCNMCESDVPESEGEMVEVLTSEDDGDLMWLCQKCRDD